MTSIVPSSADRSNGFLQAFELLSDVIVGRSGDNLTKRLHDAPPLLGVTHLAYMRVEKGRSDDVAILSAHATYPKDWQLRYFTRGYAQIDPLFAACLQATAPFEWREVREAAPQAEEFFADAVRHGLGLNGLTIPVPAPPHGYGMVSFNSDLPDDEWRAYVETNRTSLEVFACLVDSAVARNAKLPSKKIDLAKREHQALTWAARGRTAAEIGDIMGVSYATARSHLESARHKLDCENVTHAVATAIAIGLISPMALKGYDPVSYTGKDGAAPAAG